jgi:hypothetical protein
MENKFLIFGLILFLLICIYLYNEIQKMKLKMNVLTTLNTKITEATNVCNNIDNSILNFKNMSLSIKEDIKNDVIEIINNNNCSQKIMNNNNNSLEGIMNNDNIDILNTNNLNNPNNNNNEISSDSDNLISTDEDDNDDEIENNNVYLNNPNDLINILLASSHDMDIAVLHNNIDMKSIFQNNYSGIKFFDNGVKIENIDSESENENESTKLVDNNELAKINNNMIDNN